MIHSGDSEHFFRPHSRQNQVCELVNITVQSISVNSIGVILEIEFGTATVYFIGKDKIVDSIPLQNLMKIDVSKTGDEHQRKICDRCFKIKETSTEFENNRIKKGGKITKRPSCRDCRKIKNGVSIPLREKRLWERKKPKLGEVFTCPICNKKSLGGISKHVLDHNHHTGEVRGYLCESCNTGIGRFDDNVEQIKNAIDWLNRKSVS